MKYEIKFESAEFKAVATEIRRASLGIALFLVPTLLRGNAYGF